METDTDARVKGSTRTISKLHRSIEPVKAERWRRLYDLRLFRYERDYDLFEDSLPRIYADFHEFYTIRVNS
jgi:hypothetical protein